MADSTDDHDIIRELQERVKACTEHESESRAAFVDDTKFRNGDARNHWQWSQSAWGARNTPGEAALPTMTINKVAAHCFQVENQARQSQMGIKINATGFGATEKAADAIEGIIRHIESQSNAQQNAYMHAFSCALTGGIGWVHITSDYVRGADSFDQDLFIETVPNPLDVYSDPTCQQPDHSDMQWAAIVTTMPTAEFDRTYPEFKDDLNNSSAIISGLDQDTRLEWSNPDQTRVARYYRKSEEKDTLWLVPPGLPVLIPTAPTATSLEGDTTGLPTAARGLGNASGPMRESEMPETLVSLCKAMKCQHRPIVNPKVEWILVGGSRVIDRGDTVFKRIPLVPCIGIETMIDGKLDRKGLVRSLIDPQRMFNYAASKFAESLATQTQTPWLAEARTIEPYLKTWNAANRAPTPYLPYSMLDEDGNPINADKPEKIEPPAMSQGYMQAMQNADLQMQMVTGQYQAELGAPGNEKSGRAINERQRQSDTANYHYTDNQGMFLRLCGLVLLDALSEVYDTQRVLQILGMDGQMQQAVLDPAIQSSHQVALPGDQQPDPEMDVEKQLAIKGAILAINPKVGRYDVEADTGPSFATRRQDASNAYMQIVQAAPQLIDKIGDIIFRAMDEPLSDEIADRLKPASDDPQLQAAMAHIQQLTAANAQLQTALKAKQDNLQHDQVTDLMRMDLDKAKVEIDRRRAQTDRINVILTNAGNNPEPITAHLLMQLINQAMAEDAGVAPMTAHSLMQLINQARAEDVGVAPMAAPSFQQPAPAQPQGAPQQ